MNWIAILIPSLIVIAGLGLFAWAWTAYRDGRRSLGWPSVSGQVTSSSVTLETTQADSDSRLESTYYPSVSYDYRVDGQSLKGSRIGVGGAEGTARKEDAEAVAGRYAVGSKVDVYYDPANPEYAVLVRGANITMVWIIAAGGAVGLAVGIAVAIAWGR